MLINGRSFWKLHSWWLAASVLLAGAAGGWELAVGWKLGHWPSGGSWPGLALGASAAAIFLFEAALGLKKTRFFRTARWTLSAQTWMKAHIWLGLLTIPLVVLHSGGRWGGTLTILLLAVFSVVIASGLWGVALQNLLPRMLLEAAPAETIYSQIENVGRQYAAEARRIVVATCGGAADLSEPVSVGAAAPERVIRGAERVVGLQIKRSPDAAGVRQKVIDSPAIRAALTEAIDPFLTDGVGRHGLLGSRQRNQWFFDDLRLRTPPELRELVGQLEDLCEKRRQLNVQRRLHCWLHNWLWLHLPLSVSLLLLLAAHVVWALRFG